MVQEERHRQGRSLTVLDVGCGDGSVSRLFLDAGHKILGLDMVPEFVANAVERGIAALTADVTRNGLPLCEAAVDVVYAGALLEHLYDPEFFLGECRRVLTPGGIIVLTTPNIASLTSRLRMLFGRRPKFYAPALSWEFGGHVRIFTAGTLRLLLEHNSFDVEEIVSSLVSFVPTRRTRRPWSVTLGRLIPGWGEVLIVRGRKR